MSASGGVLPPTFYDSPDAAPAAPAVLVLPAMGVPAGAYRRLAGAMAALGTATAVVEWRGTGASPVKPGRRADWGYPELLEHEVLGGLAAMRSRWPGRPAVLLGHSLGGHIAMMARARATPELAGVLLVAAGTPHHRIFSPAVQRRFRLVMLLHRIVTPVVGHYPGQRLGFGGRQPRKLITEWSELAWTGRMSLHGVDPFKPRTAEVERIPVRALSLASDDLAPRAATAELLHRAGLDDACIERFEGPGPTGHFDWLKEPRDIAPRIVALARDLAGRRA